MTNQVERVVTSRTVAILSIILFAFTAAFAHRSTVSFVALALAIYVTFATWCHEKRRKLSWEIVFEYILVAFILWFVVSSLW